MGSRQRGRGLIDIIASCHWLPPKVGLFCRDARIIGMVAVFILCLIDPQPRSVMQQGRIPICPGTLSRLSAVIRELDAGYSRSLVSFSCCNCSSTCIQQAGPLHCSRAGGKVGAEREFYGSSPRLFCHRTRTLHMKLPRIQSVVISRRQRELRHLPN
jgi:hypothetical protein